MFKPRFEEPINSAEQLIENNITVITWGGEYWEQFLANSPTPEYQTLSEGLVGLNIFNYLRSIGKNIIIDGTHAYLNHRLGGFEKEEAKANGKRWWKGDLVKGHNPYGGYLSDKKWHLNEVSDIFCFIFC